MKVVLLKSFESLGRAGEVKNVSDGYASNFLLPKKIAVAASDSNVAKYSKLATQPAVKSAGRGSSPEALANKLRAIVVNFHEKVGEGGTFFAGITKEKIITAVQDKGVSLKIKQLELAEPIKKPGTYKVPVNVDSGLKSEITLIAREK